MRKILVSPFVLLVLILSFTGKAALAQTPNPTPPDCVVFLNNLTTAVSVPSGNGFDNRFVGCDSWTLQYQSSGFTGLTLTFQSSVGSVTATSFGTYTGTVVTGAAAMTSTTGQISTFANGTVVTPWVRVNLSGLTGTGTVNGVLYGYKTGYSSGNGGGGGSACPGTVGTPCVVVGPATAGAAIAGAPVMQGLSDGTNAQYGFVCNTSAAVSISSATDVVIVTGVAAKSVRICHLDFSSDTTAAVTIRQGTGTTCGTNQVALSGAYQNILGLAEDYTPLAPLTTTVAARDVCLHFSTNVTAGGTVIYAIF